MNVLIRFVRHYPRTIAALTSRALRSIGSEIGPDGALLSLGLLLLAYGAYQIHPPSGYVVPGVILVWQYLPTRPTFVARLPGVKRQTKETA